MLRHYDEIGLLKPAEIDRFTDYRYYREDQLPIVCRITALKDMGFSLADIVRILEIYDDQEQLERYFAARQRELEDLSRDTAHKLTLLDAAQRNRSSASGGGGSLSLRRDLPGRRIQGKGRGNAGLEDREGRLS